MGQQVVIELLRTAPFLRDAKVMLGGDMDDPNVDPRNIKTEPFDGRSTGSSRIAINYSLANGGYVWDEKFMTREQFKALIPKCAIMNDVTKRTITSIDEINFFNKDEPFFCNDDMTVLMSRGRVVMDTSDSNPRNKVIAAFFFADKERFMPVYGDEEPSFSSEIYSIGLIEHMEAARETAAMSEINIGAKLKEMGRPQLTVLAKLWNIEVRPETSDDIIKGRVFAVIKASPITLGPKSRAAWFEKFLNFNKETMMLYDTFMDGRRTRLISLNDDDMYTFNGVILGRHEDECVDFMKMAMNEKVVKDLKAGIKQRRKQAKDDLGAYEDSLADNAKLNDGQQSPNT